jgi:hypothetical protein
MRNLARKASQTNNVLLVDIDTIPSGASAFELARFLAQNRQENNFS